MSDHTHHGGPPPGEAPRWLDHPSNIKLITKIFFGLCGLFFVADAIFFAYHKHSTFQPAEWSPAAEGEHFQPGGIHALETTFGFYSIYGFIAIVLLVVLSVGLRKLVMQPEDFYNRDYDEPADDESGEGHHG